MKKIVLMILVLSCFAAAKLRDLVLYVDGDTPLQVANYINGLPCKWELYGELQYLNGKWRQTVICHRVNAMR